MNNLKRVAVEDVAVSQECEAKKSKTGSEAIDMLWFPDFEQPDELAFPSKEVRNEKKPVSNN